MPRNTNQAKTIKNVPRIFKLSIAVVGTFATVTVLGTAIAPDIALAGDKETATIVPTAGSKSFRLPGRRVETLEFEVAEDATRFVFDDAPLLDNGFPAYGNSFITQGYIYPPGTLTCAEEGTCNGVNSDGSPEFPDKVIGRWICRGWFVGEEGAAASSGPFVMTHQLYDFGEEFGSVTLTTDGYELADVGKPVKRAITGGTGKYLAARGEANQTFLGFNSLEGVALKFKMNVIRK